MMGLFPYIGRPVLRILLLAIGWPLGLIGGLPAFFATLEAFLTAGRMVISGHQDVAWKFLLPGILAAVTALAFWPSRLAGRLRRF
jgi:hypothetical protein